MNSTIYITDEIDGLVCENVRQQIDQALANGASKITFKINSPGGNVVSALAMYDMISALNVETEAFVYGICMSAATYMLVAADKAVATPSASIMIHPCAGGLYGTLKEIEADLEYFASLQNRVLAIYASKTGLTAEEIEEIWEPAKYFTAEEAKEFGLIDEIAGLGITNLADNETETCPETRDEDEEGKDTEKDDEARVDDSEAKEDEEEKKEDVDLEDTGSIFSFKNLVRKCKQIIKRPVVDEYDEAAELKNKIDDITAKYEALEVENKSIRDGFEANVIELKNKLDELEVERTALYNTIEEQKKNIEITINNKVNERIAALGYEEDELVEPTNKVEEINIADMVRNQGLDATLNYLVSRKK